MKVTDVTASTGWISYIVEQ